MSKKCMKLSVSILLFSCFFFFSSNAAEATSFVYPKTSHSVSEMYKKHDDFMRGNPGKAGNKGHIGKEGKSGKNGNSGKKGKLGKRGKDGKGRLVIVY